MKKVALLLLIFLGAFNLKTEAQTFTFECICDYLTTADANCDICTPSLQSRLFCGMLIRKNGNGFKWIDQPYIVKFSGNNATFQELIPASETITVALAGTGFSTLDSFKMAIDCPCNSAGVDGPLWYASDSTNHSPIYLNDTVTIVGRGIIGVEFDSALRKYIITADTTGLSGGGGTGTVTSVAATAPAAGFTISGSPITTSGTFVFTLSDDLSAVEGLSGIGIAVRTASNTWTNRSITAGTGISVTNGDGVSGNPTITNTGDTDPSDDLTGSGVSPRVAIWNGLISLTSDANLTFNGSNLFNGTSYYTHAGGARTFQKVGTNLFLAEAGNATLSGNNNIGLGETALQSLTTGNENTAVGYLAGNKLTSGGQTTYIGAYAGRFNTSGTNVGIGKDALLGVNGSSNGGGNVAVGRSALRGLTTGTINVAIGDEAGQAITSGSSHVAIGWQALFSATNSSDNTAIGLASGNTTTGSNNTYIGSGSGQNSGSGASGVFIGKDAGKFNTGPQNVLIGRQAGQGQSTGAPAIGVDNVFIGYTTAPSHTSADANVGIGKSALNLLSTGDRNITIGYQAGDAITTGTQNIIVGYDVDPSGGTVSNELRIGSALYGTTVNTLASAQLGIGVVAPQSRFDITTTGLGVTQTNTSGLLLANTTSAAAGAQQISPALRFRGQGWKTDATAASQPVDFQIDVLPVQGTASPDATLRIKSSINGGAYTDHITTSSVGRTTINGIPAGTGANNAWLNVNGGSVTGSVEGIRTSANVSADLLISIENARNTGATGDATFQAKVGGTSAGDPRVQFVIPSGATHSIGIDNSDADKFKITPGATTPGGTVDHGIILTNDATTLGGVNLDAPRHPWDVSGRNRAEQFINGKTLWNNQESLITFGAGAGTGPVINSLSGGANWFQLTFTTGTTPTAGGTVFTATYPVSFPYSVTYVVFSANGKTTATDYNRFYRASSNGTQMSIGNNDQVGALQASTLYSLTFHIGGLDIN